MISRRDAIKLGTAGLIAPTFGSTAGPGNLNGRGSGGSVPMFRGNAARTGEMPGPGPSLDKPVIVRWRFATGGYAYPPAVAAGVVFVGSKDGNLYAVDAISGVARWRFTMGDEVSSAPAVADGVVYIGSWDGNLYAVDAASGQERWRFKPEDTVGFSPAVTDGIIYVAAGENLYAIDTASGQERARFTPDPEIIQFSTLAVADDVIYVASFDGFATSAAWHFHAVDALSGNELWRIDALDTTWIPAVDNEIVYARGATGALHAIDASSGQELWRSDWGVLSNTLTVVDGSVYVEGGVGTLYAIDAASGLERWHFAANARVHSPVVADDIVYVGSSINESQASKIVSQDGSLHAIDVTSGNERWRFAAGPAMRSGSVDEFSPAVVDGGVYFNCFDGYVIAIGNLHEIVLVADVIVRGAPAESGVERGTARTGEVVAHVERREENNGQIWAKVTIGDISGWIPLDAIDPATLPPEGEIEYVYMP